MASQPTSGGEVAPKLDLGALVPQDVKAQLVQGLINALVQGVGKLLAGVFGKKKAEAPKVPVSAPQPNPVDPGEGRFLDDVIPAPAGRKIAKVRCKLSRIQLSTQRFGGELVQPTDRHEQGLDAINWGSKVWIDLTAYDEQGREFLQDAVLAHGLAFKTEHHVGAAHIVGAGADPQGNPLPYVTADTDEIGNGISAWLYSKGFLQQFKAHAAADGQSFDVWGKVGGVESNHITLKFS